MDSIREQFENPIIVGIIGFLLGIIIGWFVIGWLIFPVEWTDAAPLHLRSDLREDYLRMTIDSYNQTLDATRAQVRWQELGEFGPQILDSIEVDQGTLSPASVEAFGVAVGPAALNMEVGTERNPLLLRAACLVTLILGGALLALYKFRRPLFTEVASALRTSKAGAGFANQAEPTIETANVDMPEDPPLSQFMTTYMHGDDLFDDSFSIDSPSGEFLGECGVGIAETIGVGDPKRVSAFEVWLFDKNDIQTVTKVVMSDHIFHKEATKERLAAKGEPVMAQPGNQIVLETATLQLVARVVDMSYGDSALPEGSFFDRMTLELAVWHAT